MPSPSEAMVDEEFISAAKSVLAANDLGKSTKPAPNLYPHQWNWDSCFIAIGIARYNFARAAEEIRSLLRGQWKNGLVPQIVFNPEGSGYFPGPDVWQCERSPDAPTDVETSGITQPPVLATAALAVARRAPSEADGLDFLAEIHPKIVHYHRFLHQERDPDATGLSVVIHPWESGLDNSPPYLDAATHVHMDYKPSYERLDILHVAAKNRPTNKDYDLFVYLLEQMRAVDWDQSRYLATAQLQVQDVLFNSILCRADRDLVTIARMIGQDHSQIDAWQQATANAINHLLWSDDEGTYFSRDRLSGELLRDDTIATFHTLYGHVAPDDRARRLIKEHLLNPESYWPESGFAVPTTAIDSPWFNPENYWLGPVWVNTNWMIRQGLLTYGYDDLAETLRTQTLDLIKRSGFREYFNPLTGEGYGTDSFGWAAALAIDLAAESQAGDA